MEQIQQDHLSDLDLQVDNEVRQHLHDSAKWSKFISLTILIFCGLIFICCVLAGNAIMNALDNAAPGSVFEEFTSTAVMGIIFFAIAFVGFLYYLLYNFSAKIKMALINEDSEFLNKGLRSLKIFVIISAIASLLTLAGNIYQLVTGK